MTLYFQDDKEILRQRIDTLQARIDELVEMLTEVRTATMGNTPRFHIEDEAWLRIDELIEKNRSK